ncbi:hypothetical protein D9M72_404350 [compost metagenome]
MSQIDILTTNFFDHDDVPAIFCFKRFRNLAFFKTERSFFKFFNQIIFPVDPHETTVGFRPFIFTVQYRLTKKATISRKHIGPEFIELVDDFLLFCFCNFRVYDYLRNLNLSSNLRQVFFWKLFEKSSYFFWSDFYSFNDLIPHFGSKLAHFQDIKEIGSKIFFSRSFVYLKQFFH